MCTFIFCDILGVVNIDGIGIVTQVATIPLNLISSILLRCLVVRMSGSHPGGPGSIPGGEIFAPAL